MGFPIQKSPDHRIFAASPELIAGYYVFHRLWLPRHPPHALNYLTIQPQTVVAPTSSTRTDRLLDHTVCCSVYLNTVQLQFNSHTKTLDSVNFASNSFLQSSSSSNKSLLMSILKTSMNKLFQLKYILLMIFPAFVRSGNCDKSQKLISYLLTNFCNPTYLREAWLLA